ncbi:MAG TPA: hypothetical protein DIT67_01770 [Octadecabacter sp.]|nr:hypothetical protein [Octadecabacter sp.]
MQMKMKMISIPLVHAGGLPSMNVVANAAKRGSSFLVAPGMPFMQGIRRPSNHHSIQRLHHADYVECPKAILKRIPLGRMKRRARLVEYKNLKEVAGQSNTREFQRGIG